MKRLTLWGTLIFGVLGPPPHIFEDGFVERTVAIVVRDKSATVEYSIGMNANTMESLVQEWEKLAKPETAKPETAKPETGKPESVERPSSPHPPETSPKKDALPEQPNGDAGTRNQEENSKSVGANLRESEDPQPEHVIDAELMARFEKLAPTVLADRLRISCNGNRVPVTAAQLGPAPRHPFVLLARFEFELPPGKLVDVQVTDTNFAAQPGAIRMALKTAGNAMLMRSTAAPIIIRAKRIELETLTDDEKQAQTKLTASIGFAGETSK